ncbi:MAG: hypothetical protein AB8B83_01840 [Bdellovibrionales bacterium]
MQKILFTCCLAITTLLIGCTPSTTTNNRVETPTTFKDPTNEQLHEAILNFMKTTGAPVSSTYNFVRFDLDGDKRREAIIMVKAPYGYWCGQHGCVLMVMKAHNNGFTFVNAVQPVREPIFISRAKTNGWNNVVVRISGRWSETKNVLLRFDGKQYPDNPETLSPYPINPANHPDFIRVLYDEDTID